MKFYSKIIFFITGGLSLAFFSCSKPETYPVIPFISYQGFTLLLNEDSITERGILQFSFTDGDGDIGLTQADTLPPYDFNLYVTYFEKQNGIYKKVDLPSTLNARIPVLTPSGNIKSIKGDIEDTLYVNNPASTFDTIKFEVYIVDRALHQSNVIETPDIVIKKH